MNVFPRNMGKADRIIRAVVGLVLTSMAFVGPANPWFLLGLIPLFTAVVGWCPAYQPFGFSTRKYDKVMKM